jgi:hypothetical protein
MARLPRRPARPTDLFDYQQERHITPHSATPAAPPITVTDDWPVAVLVTDHEARVVEAFFADVLDELFGPIP